MKGGREDVMHHFEAGAQGFQGLVDQNDGEKA